MQNEINETVKKVLEQLHNGDHISNKNLDVTIKELKRLTDLLFILGNRYYFTWQSLHNDLSELEYFSRARKQRY
jgi:hypothetical protein